MSVYLKKLNGKEPQFWWLGNEKTLREGRQSDFFEKGSKGVRFIVVWNGEVMVTNEGSLLCKEQEGAMPCFGIVPEIMSEHLGDSKFCHEYGVSYAYMTGAMANGIASSRLVIEAAKAGFLSAYGSGGVPLEIVEKEILSIQKELGSKTFAVNLLSNPHNIESEFSLVKLCLKHRVKVVEASAFIRLSLPLIYYRVSGLSYDSFKVPLVSNKVIAKVSRTEVAQKFLMPPPIKEIETLLKQGFITSQQFEIAKIVPMADDITVEADSGGHTDNRPLVSLLPSIISLRDTIQNEYQYKNTVRIGAAGGISTPSAALAAYNMGAAYIVTGSINQACVEAATSIRVKELLCKAQMADVAMAPSADMFEVGAKVQVLKNGTMYAVNAQKLYQFYLTYDSLENISEADKKILENRIFKKSIEEVWLETKNYFKDTAPQEIEKGEANSKHKMVLVLRWYLGMSSKWAVSGEPSRVMDYQIWCGQSMGAFNEWVKGSALESMRNRKVANLGHELINGVIKLKRLQYIRDLGCDF